MDLLLMVHYFEVDFIMLEELYSFLTYFHESILLKNDGNVNKLVIRLRL